MGTSLACSSVQVLLTDLPTLVENAIHPNLIQNKAAMADLSKRNPPSRLGPHAIPIGHGWVGCTALDWTRSLEDQLTPNQCQGIDVVVVSNCVWLVEMLDALLKTAAAVFAATSNKNNKIAAAISSCSFLMSFQQGDPKEGGMRTQCLPVSIEYSRQCATANGHGVSRLETSHP